MTRQRLPHPFANLVASRMHSDRPRRWSPPASVTPRRSALAGLPVAAICLALAAGCANFPARRPDVTTNAANLDGSPAVAGSPSGVPSATPPATGAANDPASPLAPPPTRLVSDRGAIDDSSSSGDDGRYVARQFPETLPAPPPVTPPITGVPAPGGVPTAPLGMTGNDVLPPLSAPAVMPRTREADLIINGFPARTGRIMFGGAVNSDAGVTGQITIDERNFDITRWPRSFQDLFSGTAFRGAGQTFRLEAVPGSEFDRYTIQFADPNLLGYLPISMSVSGFLFDRRFNDWDEERLGGRLSLGYRVTPDLSVSAGISGQNVEIARPRVLGVPQLDDVLGDNELYGGEVSLTHDTRDSPIQASRGHFFQFTFEEVFGSYDYARFETEYRTYFLLAQRADTSGKQTLSYSVRLGFSGEDTPIFENFFAGGYATMRGFDFRGASPVVGGVEVGGRFQWLNSVEYMFPITADDAFRGVAFVDFGTVEQDIEINADNFRVVPGVGFRIAIPMLGPAPLAFDFGFPVAQADTDDERMFSFYMSAIR